MLSKCCSKYDSKYGKLRSGHRTRKGQFSFQSQRKVKPKNAQTAAQCTHPTCCQSNAQNSPPGFNSTWTMKFQMFKLDLEKAEEPEIKLSTSTGSSKKQESSNNKAEKHLFLLYWLCQSLWLCGSLETVENSEREGNTRPPDLSLEKSVCRSGSNS